MIEPEDRGSDGGAKSAAGALARFSLDYLKWGLLLPGAPGPRLALLRRQDFRSVFRAALRGQSNRSIVVVGNYEFGPITPEPCRAKARLLRPRRSYFDPVIGNQASVRFDP